MADLTYKPLTIDSYFDKIFYINLKKDIERNDRMISQFRKFGIANFERVDATELKALPGTEKYRNFIKKENKYLIGGLSCRASHVKCIKIAKERGYSRVLIFEDDALFLENPNQLLIKNAGMLHEWDMVYFGGLIEPHFRNQIVCTHAYGVKCTLFDDIINMAIASGMEIDNFYAKILHHMSYNYNQSGKYNIRIILPFNLIVQNKTFNSNIHA